MVLAFCTESSLCLTHLVELRIVMFVGIVFENFILLVLQVLVLQLFDDLFLLCTSLTVLQVVHVQLVLQVVDIGVLLYVSAVEPLQLGLQPLVLLLELRLHVLNALEALVSTLQLNAPPLDRVLEDGFVTAERLHCFLHFFHLACLGVDDVSNTLFNVLLFSILVQVTAD